MLAYGAAQPAQAPVFEDLTAWLTAHHLSYGLSGYTQANIVTVEGQGNITLRPARWPRKHLCGAGSGCAQARTAARNAAWLGGNQERSLMKSASMSINGATCRPAQWGVTPETQRLLLHWRDPDRERKLFFCQREAVENADLADRGRPEDSARRSKTPTPKPTPASIGSPAKWRPAPARPR